MTLSIKELQATILSNFACSMRLTYNDAGGLQQSYWECENDGGIVLFMPFPVRYASFCLTDCYMWSKNRRYRWRNPKLPTIKKRRSKKRKTQQEKESLKESPNVPQSTSDQSDPTRNRP